jgi:hypothetical protein
MFVKSFLLLLLSATLLLLSNLTTAQESKLIPYGEWGSASYKQTVTLNGYYYVSTRNSNHIDVIDPTKEGEASLIEKFSFSEENNTAIQAIEIFNDHLVIVTANELSIYSSNGITDFTLEYSISLGDYYSENNGVIVSDKIYIVSGTQIFIIDFIDDGFAIEKVIPVATEFTKYFDDRILLVVDDSIIFIGRYYNRDIEEWHFLLEQYNTNSYELIKTYIYDTEDLYFNHAAAVDKNRIVFNPRTRLKTMLLNDDGIVIEDNFSEFNTWSSNRFEYFENTLWSQSSNSFVSYNIDINNNVTKSSEVDFASSVNSNWSLEMSDINWVDNGLVIVSNYYGLSEITVEENTLVGSANHLFHRGGYKGRGVVINDKYYFPNVLTGSIISLDISTPNNITWNSSKSINNSIRNIDPLNGNYLFSGSNYLSIQEFESFDGFNPLSTINKGVNNGFIFNDLNLFSINWNNENVLGKYDISTPYKLYESPITASFPESDNTCPDGLVKYKNYLLAKDGCENYKYHLFSNNEEDTLTYIKLIEPIYLYNYSTVVNSNYLYFINRTAIKITSLNDENEFIVNKTVQTDFSTDVVSALIKDDKLAVATYEAIYLYDLSDELLPVLISKTDMVLTYESELFFSENMLIVNSYYSGVIKFMQFNDAPQATINAIEVNEDENIILSEIFIDPDNENDEIIQSIVESPTNGELVFNSGFIYTPNSNFNGEDKFRIKAEDIYGNFTEQEIEVTVLPVNDAPTIGVNTLSTLEDTEIVETLDIIDIDGDQLSYTITLPPSNGEASINDSGELEYQPNLNFYGSDFVEVRVLDIKGVSVNEVISINIESVNDLPIIDIEAYSGMEDNQAKGQIIANDIEEQLLTFSVVAGSGINGQASIQSNGMFTFTPHSNFNGQASFDVQVSDSEQGTIQETIFIDFEGVDDLPVAESLIMNVSHNGSSSGSLLAIDVDGDNLIYSIITDVSNGTLTLTSKGDYSYSPNSSYSGNDSVTYEVTDGKNRVQGLLEFSVEPAPIVAPPKTSKDSSGGGGTFNYLVLFLFMSLIYYRKAK